MKTTLKVPETVEEWHSPHIPVIASRAQQYAGYGFYLLKGIVSVGSNGEAFNNMQGSSAHSDRMRRFIWIKFPDGERKVDVMLKCSASPENANAKTLVGLLNEIPASGLEGSIGVHHKNGGRVVNYIMVNGSFEAVVKGSGVPQIYAPPVYAIQPAP